MLCLPISIVKVRAVQGAKRADTVERRRFGRSRVLAGPRFSGAD